MEIFEMPVESSEPTVFDGPEGCFSIAPQNGNIHSATDRSQDMGYSERSEKIPDIDTMLLGLEIHRIHILGAVNGPETVREKIAVSGIEDFTETWRSPANPSRLTVFKAETYCSQSRRYQPYSSFQYPVIKFTQASSCSRVLKAFADQSPGMTVQPGGTHDIFPFGTVWHCPEMPLAPFGTTGGVQINVLIV
jgi:hypothetical protein